MREQTILGVLIYLYKQHLQNLDPDQLIDELETVGFCPDEISQAFDWLQVLKLRLTSTPEIHYQHSNALRVYSEYEIKRINPAARGYLTQLEQENILEPKLREIIIHQALALKRELVDLNLIKWLTLIVLCNQVENDEPAHNTPVTAHARNQCHIS